MMSFSVSPPDDSPETDTDLSLTPDERRFIWMLGLSLLLHLLIAAVMGALPKGGGPFHSPPVVEVSLDQLPPAESTLPPEKPEVPDNEAIPEPAASEQDVSPPLPESAVPEPEPSPSPEPSSISFSISAGSFMSFGDGTTLRDELRPYFLDMLERINRSWQQTGKGVRLARGAMLLVSIDRGGKMRGVRILQSSGDRRHDRLLVDAIERGEYAPLPEGYEKETFEAPIRFSPPLSLMNFDTFLSRPPPH